MSKVIDNLENLPEFLVSKHLVELGIYPTLDAVYQARLRGASPNYIKLSRKILYPKISVVEFLENRMKIVDHFDESKNIHDEQTIGGNEIG